MSAGCLCTAHRRWRTDARSMVAGWCVMLATCVLAAHAQPSPAPPSSLDLLRSFTELPVFGLPRSVGLRAPPPPDSYFNLSPPPPPPSPPPPPQAPTPLSPSPVAEAALNASSCAAQGLQGTCKCAAPWCCRRAAP